MRKVHGTFSHARVPVQMDYPVMQALGERPRCSAGSERLKISGDSSMKSLLPTVCLLIAVVPLAQATSVRADKLPPPKSMTCLQVRQAISYTVTQGLLHIPFDHELEPGAYVSEREDAKGIYYRAPEGALTVRRTDVKEDSRAGHTMTFDGGIYVPDDPAAAPTLYKYYATDSVLTQPASGNTDCATLSYTVDPNTHKISLVAMGMATGLGAATGMVVGRSIHPHVQTSYGQAAGVGLAGGLIGGLIVAAIENSKVGEIVPGPGMDNQADEKIRMLAANKVAVGEQGHAGESNVTASAPSAAAGPAEAIRNGASGEVQTVNSAATAVTVASADGAMAPLAQSVATQMGCGAIKDSGEAEYVASCGSYGIDIGCDAGKCRPLHTVKLKGDE
jgi:hypothetical protein